MGDIDGTETLTTYKRADGEPIDGDIIQWSTDIDGWEFEEPTEIIEEVWVLKSRRTFTLPTCSQCDEPAEHWGLCEKHAREDDPEYSESTEWAVSDIDSAIAALRRKYRNGISPEGNEYVTVPPDLWHRLLDVAEAAARVNNWMAEDRYTQVEKVDGGFDLVHALDRLAATVTERSTDADR